MGIISLEKEVEKEFAENKIQLKDNNENIEALKQEFGKNVEDITSLNKTYKNMEDQIKRIDDTLNGINSSVSLFENRHIETVEKMKEVSTLASNIEVQVKQREQKIQEINSSEINEVKDQIVKLESSTGRKMTELDAGSQALLEKLLGLETGLSSWVEALGKTDVDLLGRINTIKAENEKEIDMLAKSIQETESKQADQIAGINTQSKQLLAKFSNDYDDKLDDCQKKMEEKFNSLDADSKQNLQSFVTLQESINLQSEKVQKVDAERQQAAAQVKEEFAATVNTNAKAIADMKAELEDAIIKLEEKLKGNQLKDNSALEQKLKGIQDSNDSNSNKIEELKIDTGKKMIEMETGNQKILEKVLGLEKDLESTAEIADKNSHGIASHANLLRENTENINDLITADASFTNKIIKLEKDHKNTNDDLENLKNQTKINCDDIKTLQQQTNMTKESISTVDEKIRVSENHIKNIDDTLDGLNKSMKLFE